MGASVHEIKDLGDEMPARQYQSEILNSFLWLDEKDEANRTRITNAARADRTQLRLANFLLAPVKSGSVRQDRQHHPMNQRERPG